MTLLRINGVNYVGPARVGLIDPDNQTIAISYIEISFKERNGTVYIVDGGIGNDFFSFVINVPKASGAISYSTRIFGKQNPRN